MKRSIHSYLLDCDQLSPATRHVYKLALGRLKRHLRKRHVKRVDKVTPDHIRGFLVAVQAGDYRQTGSGPVSAATLHQHFRAVRTFFSWCKREGLIARSPMENVRPPAMPSPATHYLEPDDIGRLLAACDDTQHPIRDLAITVLFLDTGLRRDELARLLPADIDLTERIVTVELGKMGKGRVVPLSSRCCEVLSAWLAIRPPELATVFGLGGPNIYQIFYRMRQRTPELGNVAPHQLRHTFGTYYAGDIKDTSLLLGHSDISLTAKTYCHRQALGLVDQHDDRTPLRLIFPRK